LEYVKCTHVFTHLWTGLIQIFVSPR